jgi:two-component system phosphate regulon response regulator PhoB
MMAKILIVNDEADLVDMTKMILESEGYEVDGTIDGRRAITLARAAAPDLILLDFVLSGTNGAEVLRGLRSDELTRSIPVVMMSALRDGELRARQAGATDFLAKPFSAEALIGAVRRSITPSTLNPPDVSGNEGGRQGAD